MLKKPDRTLQSAHDYCRTFEAAELQKFKFNLPTNAGTERPSGIQFVKRSKGQDRITARSCKFCGYKHPFTQPSRCPAFGKKGASSVRKKDILQRFAKRMPRKAPKLTQWNKKIPVMMAIKRRVRMYIHILDLLNWEVFLTTERQTTA